MGDRVADAGVEEKEVTTVRVLVVDDDMLARNRLVEILSEEQGIEIIGEAADGESAVEWTRKCDIDVVLMDLRMPGMGGIRATKVIRKRHPGVAVLILTAFNSEQDILVAMEAGSHGHLLKSASPEQIRHAIYLAAGGLTVLSPEAAVVMRSFPSHGRPAPAGTLHLSDRDRRIVAQVSQGASNREIAKRLGLTETTVKTYVSRILQRLGCRTRGHLAARARELGIDRLPL